MSIKILPLVKDIPNYEKKIIKVYEIMSESGVFLLKRDADFLLQCLHMIDERDK